VVVEPGAVVRDSVIMNNVRIRAGSTLEGVIVDKHTEIGEGCRIGGGAPCKPNTAMVDTHTCGVTIIGRECVIPANSEIGRNTQIAPGTEPESRILLPDGASLDGSEVYE
jgi:glucose-1-phosphate adenylyltransferase